MKWLISLSLLLGAMFSTNLLAEQQGGQFKRFHTWDVHYIAFPSTVIKPEIATTYGLQRSGSNAVINISVLEKSTQKAQAVVISGTAKNLLGQKTDLAFKEIKEQDAIYYIAQLKYSDQETYRFDIQIRQGDQTEKLVFQQKFYVD